MFFFMKRLTLDEARDQYASVIEGYSNELIAAAIEGRIESSSIDYDWSRRARKAYKRYQRHLSFEQQSFQRSQRLALLDLTVQNSEPAI